MVSDLVQAYEAIKREFPGFLVLQRLGDFFESFGDDAETIGEICGIRVTKRDGVPIAGFPCFSLFSSGYGEKLQKAGKKFITVQEEKVDYY